MCKNYIGPPGDDPGPKGTIGPSGPDEEICFWCAHYGPECPESRFPAGDCTEALRKFCSKFDWNRSQPVKKCELPEGCAGCVYEHDPLSYYTCCWCKRYPRTADNFYKKVS
jgi:hypothetical protein